MRNYNLQEIVLRWKETNNEKDLIDFRDGTYAYVKNLLNKYYKFKSREELDEIVSKTFFQIWTHIDSYDESIAKYTTWVGKIAINEYRAYFQNKRLAKFHYHKASLEVVETLEDKIDHEDKLINIKKKLSSIGTLGFILNEIFINEVPQHEFAKKYNLNLNNVKTWTKKGKMILSEMLLHNNNEGYQYFNKNSKSRCPYCGLIESKELMNLHIQICQHKEVKIYDL